MARLAARYPGYGWEHNPGYATRDHRAGDGRAGLTPFHRRSFIALQRRSRGEQLDFDLLGDPVAVAGRPDRRCSSASRSRSWPTTRRSTPRDLAMPWSACPAQPEPRRSASPERLRAMDRRAAGRGRGRTATGAAGGTDGGTRWPRRDLATRPAGAPGAAERPGRPPGLDPRRSTRRSGPRRGRSSSSRSTLARRGRASACPRRSLDRAARRPLARPGRSRSSRAGAPRTSSSCRRSPLRCTSWRSADRDAAARSRPCVRHHLAASRCRRGGPIGTADARTLCYDSARSGSRPGPSRRCTPASATADGAHTRTVPTGAVPATEPRRPGPGPRDEARGGTNRTGGRSPCRPSRCGSCSRPASTSATRLAAGIPRCARSSSRSATGSTSSTSPRPSSASTSPSRPSARRSPAASSVLFVGTKKQAQEPIAQEATRAGMPYVNKRWLGGMLTNFVTIKKRMGLLEQLEARQADRRLRAHAQEGSRQADRGADQAPGHARRHAQDEAPARARSSSSTRIASGSP